ncbi:MAG: [LysW]-lysine hydrolase [Phycisphaerales bacterium JB040]
MNQVTPEAQLLIDLVSIPSVSGTERPASEHLARAATELGFESGVDDVGNALAWRDSGGSIRTHIVLLGHIDTVPGNIPVRVEDGVLHGRGSVDAKGPLCAMLCAAARAELPRGVRITVAGAVGEESAGSPGARALVGRLRPDACVIGEPSGWDGVTLGYKGRLLARAEVSVPNHHSAGQDPSAGDVLVSWWRTVGDTIARLNHDRERAFDIVQATVQGMGSGTDGLNQTAWMEAGFRLPVDISPDDLTHTIERLTTGPVRVEFSGPELAHATDRNDPVVRALSGAIRAQGARPRPKLKTGTADFNVVGPAWRCPIAAYGPGDSALDHTPEERLDLDEYHRSIRVLTGAIESLAEELLSARRPSEALSGACA